MRLVECVPNFSEGRNMQVIDQITAEIKKVKGVKLLDVDPGYDTNRTVVTFVGDVEPVKEAAFQAIKKSHELIDMSKHKGAHPRFGACDVCPLVPVSGITMEETAEEARKLGKRLGEELNFPVYFYEKAAMTPERENLAVVREGEYEALEERMKDEANRPDAGPFEFNPTTGATAVGAREFLIAYNINLNTTNVKPVKAIANVIREQGRKKKDKDGNKVHIPGMFKNCKAIGWYVDDYKIAQISINLTNYNVTNMHHVYDAVEKLALEKGMRVTGSEIVGVVPKKALLDAGVHYLEKQGMCAGIDEDEIIKIACRSLGVSDVAEFNPEEKIIERMIKEEKGLVDLTLTEFNDMLSTDSPAPGGGSVAALCGALAASLGSMVMNLSFGKKGYKENNIRFNEIAKDLQARKYELLKLIDEDTNAFNIMMGAAGSLKKAKKSGDECLIKKAEKENRYAQELGTTIPLKVMEKSLLLTPIIKEVAAIGNTNAASDAGVAALMINSAVKSAGLNVKINLSGFDKQDKFRVETEAKMAEFLHELDCKTNGIVDDVEKIIG
ncbi:MAG: glutamate formimidoyltransferase [Candidatus Cloacimonadota bacterium]|nr:MAG: glutamate formimidoyltransferase [Candidatus Cloacimonadota bacterium]PIE78014.1 MAG: glutamate formimidoyltransferase [Candidatus Delongbacteria bacterium]